MVYINSRGEIVEHRPFWVQITDFIYGFVEGVGMFFRSLFAFVPSNNGRGQTSYRSAGGRGGGTIGGPRTPGMNRARIAGLGKDGGPGAPPCAPGGG